MSTSDEDIALITEKLTQLDKIKSIILFGSKAKKDMAQLQSKSDYDIFVILPFVLIPIYYKKLKNIESSLKRERGIDASINPLPLFRLKRAKGNLLFFKMKNEGVVLFGEDYLSKIDVGNITDVDSDELFTYYFSSVRFLIKDLRSFNHLSEKDSTLLGYNIAKSILYCSELREYLNGEYIQDRIKVLREMTDSNCLIGNDTRFEPLIVFALKIFQGEKYTIDELIDFWFLARDYSTSTFELLAKEFDLGTDKEAAIEKYQEKKFTLVKACQYAILSFLKNKKMRVVSLVKRTSVERHLYACSFDLMKSIKSDFIIDDFSFYKAHHALVSSHLIENKVDEIAANHEIWNMLKNCVMINWDIACGKSII